MWDRDRRRRHGTALQSGTHKVRVWSHCGREWTRPAEVEGPLGVHDMAEGGPGGLCLWGLWELKNVVKEKARV